MNDVYSLRILTVIYSNIFNQPEMHLLFEISNQLNDSESRIIDKREDSIYLQRRYHTIEFLNDFTCLFSIWWCESIADTEISCTFYFIRVSAKFHYSYDCSWAERLYKTLERLNSSLPVIEWAKGTSINIYSYISDRFLSICTYACWLVIASLLYL